MYQSVKEKAKSALRVGAGAGALIAAGSSQAAIDISSVTTGVSDATAAITTIGVAILGVVVLIAAYMWVRKPIK